MIPPQAIPLWIEGDAIYAAVPSKSGGDPVYFKYSVTEGGLSKALKLLQTRAVPAKRHAAGATPTTLTPDQRRSALAYTLLKRSGML